MKFREINKRDKTVNKLIRSFINSLENKHRCDRESSEATKSVTKFKKKQQLDELF